MTDLCPTRNKSFFSRLIRQGFWCIGNHHQCSDYRLVSDYRTDTGPIIHRYVYVRLSLRKKKKKEIRHAGWSSTSWYHRQQLDRRQKYVAAYYDLLILAHILSSSGINSMKLKRGFRIDDSIIYFVHFTNSHTYIMIWINSFTWKKSRFLRSNLISKFLKIHRSQILIFLKITANSKPVIHTIDKNANTTLLSSILFAETLIFAKEKLSN